MRDRPPGRATQWVYDDTTRQLRVAGSSGCLDVDRGNGPRVDLYVPFLCPHKPRASLSLSVVLLAGRLGLEALRRPPRRRLTRASYFFSPSASSVPLSVPPHTVRPRRVPYSFTPMGVNSISPAHLHARPMRRTCRQAVEIKKKHPPDFFTALRCVSRHRYYARLSSRRVTPHPLFLACQGTLVTAPPTATSHTSSSTSSLPCKVALCKAGRCGAVEQAKAKGGASTERGVAT